MDILQIATEGLALAGKATAGPWVQRTRSDSTRVDAGNTLDDGQCVASCYTSTLAPPAKQARANAALIAHAGTHYAALCSAVIELSRDRDEWEKTCLEQASETHGLAAELAQARADAVEWRGTALSHINSMQSLTSDRDRLAIRLQVAEEKYRQLTDYAADYLRDRELKAREA